MMARKTKTNQYPKAYAVKSDDGERPELKPGKSYFTDTRPPQKVKTDPARPMMKSWFKKLTSTVLLPNAKYVEVFF